MANPKIDYDKIAEEVLGPIPEEKPIEQIEDPNTFGANVARAVRNTKQSFFEGVDAVGTAIENKTGENAFTNYLQDFGKTNSAKEQQALDKLGTPTLTTSVFDIDSAQDAAEFGKYALATGAGSAVPSVAALGAGRILLAPLFATGPIGIVLGTALSASPIIAAGIGEVFKSAKDKGASEEEAAEGAIMAGVANGLLDTAFAGKILSKIFNPVKSKELLKNLGKESLGKKIVKDSGKLAVVGGATEAVQGGISEIASSKLAGQDIDAKEVAKQSINEGLIGGIFGGATGVGTGSLARMEEKTLLAQNEDAKLHEQIDNQIKKEDLENARVVRKTTKEIDAKEKQLNEIDKILKDEPNKKVLQAEIIQLNKRIKTAPLQDKANLFSELNQKKNELRMSDSVRLKNRRKRLQKELKDSQKLLDEKKLNKPFKGDVFIMPPRETYIGKAFRKLGEAGIPFVSKPVQVVDSLSSKLLGRATTKMGQEAIRTYRKTGDTTGLRLYSKAEQWNTDYMNRAGSYMSILQRAFDDLRPITRLGLGKEISGKDRKEVYDSLIHDKGYIKKKLGNTKRAKTIEQTDSTIRDLLKKIANDLKDAGVNIQVVKNYLPIRYNRIEGQVEKDFKEILTKEGFKNSQIDVIKDKINGEGGFYASKILSPFVKKGTKAAKRTKAGFENTRKFDEKITQQFIDKGIINNDVIEILPSYIINAAKAIEFENKFGSKFADELNKAKDENRISQEFAEQASGIANAIQGKYGTAIKGVFRKPYQFLMTAGYVTTLPLAAFTALSEPLILFASAKPGAALKAAIQAPVNAFKRTARVFLPRLKKTDTEKAFEEILYGLDGSLTERMNAASAIEMPTKFTDKFFKLTMLTQVTQLSRQMAFDGFRNQLRKDIKEVLNTDKGSVRALELNRQYQQVGIPSFYNLINNLKGKSVDDIINKSPEIKSAATRFVDEQIMTPNPTNRPLWMSNPLLAFTSQLKSFMFVFGNTVGMKMLRGTVGTNVRPTQRLSNIFKATLALSLIMAASQFTDLLKEMVKSAGTDDPVTNFDELMKKKKQYGQEGLVDAVLRTNVAGGGTSLKIALDSYKYGSSPLVSILGGPIGTSLDKFLIAGGKAMEGKPRSLARQFVNSLPFVNINREIKDDLVNILIGEKEGIENYEDFRKQLGLDNYFKEQEKLLQGKI